LIETRRTIDAYCLECDLVWPISAQERVAIAEVFLLDNVPVSEEGPRVSSSVDSRIPMVVQMHLECARCGHTEDETYEFHVPFAKSGPMEKYEPGKCPECRAPIQMHLKRTQQRQ